MGGPRFRFAAAVIGLGLGVAGAAGCKDDAIVALEGTRATVCACQDAPCVNAAMDAMKDHPTKNPRKAEAIAREITDCVARIYGLSDAAPPPPDAGAADAGAADAGAGSATTP